MTTPALELHRQRWTRPLLLALAVAVVAGFGAWYATHPRDLATSDTVVTASVTVGAVVYVGVYEPQGDDARPLEVSGVQVHGSSTAAVTVEPLLCRGGGVGVTTDASLFCTDLVDPEGAHLAAGDSLVLAVSGDTAATVDLDRVDVAFRDGLQWGVTPAGSPVQVTVVGR